MFRITNNQIMQCKLRFQEETADSPSQSLLKDWQRLRWVHLHNDLLPPTPQEGTAAGEVCFQNEQLAGAATALGMAQIHRCSAYYVSDSFRRFCRSNARRKLPKLTESQDVDDWQVLAGENRGPWWHLPLELILSMGQRMWVYQQLLNARGKSALGDLAEAMFSKKSQRSNFSACPLGLDALGVELGRLIIEDRFGPDWLKRISKCLDEQEVNGAFEDQLEVVAEALVESLSAETQDWWLLFVRGPNLKAALENIKNATEAVGPSLLKAAVAEHLEWVQADVAPQQVQGSSLWQWLEKVPKTFDIEHASGSVLDKCVLGKVVDWAGHTAPKPVPPKKSAVPSHEVDEEQHLARGFDISVDRKAMRKAMLGHFARRGWCESRYCHEIVLGLVAGKSLDEIRVSFQALANKRDGFPIQYRPPRSPADCSWKRIEARLTEWTQWMSGVHDRKKIDDTIEIEIPKKARQILGTLTDCLQRQDWQQLWKSYHESLPICETVCAAYFSVLLDDVQKAFCLHYRMYQHKSTSPQLRNLKGHTR